MNKLAQWWPYVQIQTQGKLTFRRDEDGTQNNSGSELWSTQSEFETEGFRLNFRVCQLSPAAGYRITHMIQTYFKCFWIQTKRTQCVRHLIGLDSETCQACLVCSAKCSLLSIQEEGVQQNGASCFPSKPERIYLPISWHYEMLDCRLAWNWAVRFCHSSRHMLSLSIDLITLLQNGLVVVLIQHFNVDHRRNVLSVKVSHSRVSEG